MLHSDIALIFLYVNNIFIILVGLATWFLNNYLENLDTSLLLGVVELENVPIRKDALRFIEPSLSPGWGP
jgi:hypothetical protein